MDIVDALRQPCLVDTSLLTNFLFSGNALLLNQLIGQPMQITPAILDAAEVDLIDSDTATCASEVLRPLFASEEKQERYKMTRTHILSFARASGTMWTGVGPRRQTEVFSGTVHRLQNCALSILDA